MMMEVRRAEALLHPELGLNPNWKGERESFPKNITSLTSHPRRVFLITSRREMGLKSLGEGLIFLGRRISLTFLHEGMRTKCYHTKMRAVSTSSWIVLGQPRRALMEQPESPGAVPFFLPFQ